MAFFELAPFNATESCDLLRSSGLSSLPALELNERASFRTSMNPEIIGACRHVEIEYGSFQAFNDRSPPWSSGALAAEPISSPPAFTTAGDHLADTGVPGIG